MKSFIPHRAGAALVFGLAAVSCSAALAQGCKPGERIEYKAQGFPEKWETGVCIRPLPGGTQVLVRQAPTQFFPEGFEKAYALNEVRPAGGAPAAAGARANTPAQAQAPAPQPRTQPAPLTTQPQPATASPTAGKGMMSEQDVLGFLQVRLGNGDSFANPARAQVMQQLRAEILRRGVSFRYHAVGEFSNQLSKYGAGTEVRYPIAENFGPPARLEELSGRWRLLKVGAPTTFNKGNETWRRMEYSGDAGSLTINADGSYAWDSPSGPLKGRWRKATAAEMSGSHKGGEGVVLLKAKNGGDWLVSRRNEEGPEGAGILILGELPAYNSRERGVR